MKAPRTWIVVADGAHAQIYVNEGVGKGLTLLQEAGFEGDNRPSRDIAADRAGMTFASSGDGRRRKQPSTDPHRQAQLDFTKELIAVLEAGHRKDNFDRLVIVAAPRTLGDFRKRLPAPLKNQVYRELDKDLTHLNLRELSTHLSSVLAL